MFNKPKIEISLMKYFFAFFFITSIISAQDFNFNLKEAKEYSFPGVKGKSPSQGILLEYRRQPNFGYSKYTVNFNDRITTKIKIPLLLQKSQVLLLGYQYRFDRYQFQDNTNFTNTFPDTFFDELNNEQLKTIRTSLYYTKSFDSKHYISSVADLRSTGDFSGGFTFKDRYASYRFALSYGIKQSEYKEWGFGLFYSKSFRRTFVYPFAFYNKTYNDKWGVEFAIPVKMKVRYNMNPMSLILFGPEFESRTYSLDVGMSNDIIHYRRRAITFPIEYQRKIKGWLWAKASLSYIYHMKSLIENTATSQSAEIQPDSGVYFKLGMFISPKK